MGTDTALTRPGTNQQLLTQLAAAECDAIIRLALGDDVPHAQRVAVLAAMRNTARRPTITWSEPEPGRHVIEAPTGRIQLWSDLTGLAAARAAMKAPGQKAVRAAEFALPGARHADVACRAAIKRAAALLADVCETLAIAVDGIRVLDDFIVFNPRGAAADIVIIE